jgi:nicotinate-nucleotide adenylyltransferase
VERIGLFGGSFDPIHLGHLLAAQAAFEELQLSRLFFIPAAQSPFKPESHPAPAQIRLRLLRLALAGYSQYEVDDQEIRRGAPSFTIDTVRDHTRRYPGASFFYLIGADHIPQLPKWREADELARLVEFVAIARPGASATTPPSGFRVRSLQGFPLGLSSSQVRARVKAGLSIRALVPPAVAEAIRNSKLYL